LPTKPAIKIAAKKIRRCGPGNERYVVDFRRSCSEGTRGASWEARTEVMKNVEVNVE
jgi:hypothetical protein